MVEHYLMGVVENVTENRVFPVGVRLRFDSEEDALAIEVGFNTPGSEDEVIWTVDRELMNKGAKSKETVGEGDVKFKLDGPLGTTLIMCLTGEKHGEIGHADVQLPTVAIRAFLSLTYQELPAKMVQQRVETDVDDAIRMILEGGA